MASNNSLSDPTSGKKAVESATDIERNSLSSPQDEFKEKIPHDDPLAGHIEGGVNYKSMAWWQAGMVMVAETISLGILALPAAIATLGIIPGFICLLGLGAMATYSGYVIGQYKWAYPHIHSMADAGNVLFGKWGRKILGTGQLLFFVFIMGAHILTFTLAMNTITHHGACGIIWTFIGFIISFIFTLPRTLKNLSWYSIASFISIIGAVMTTMIAAGISKPGWDYDISTQSLIHEARMWPAPETTFYQGFLAVQNMIFAYAGHVAFFSFIAELKNPKDFPKALAFLQVSDISMYIITAMVVYYYAGNDVASPAINSIGNTSQIIAYAIAMPTIIIAGVVNGHVAVKYLYVKLLKDNKENIMHQKTWKARGIWALICLVLWLASWFIALAVPVFNDLLGITSALFASWFTFGLSGMFWMHMNIVRPTRWSLKPVGGWTKVTIICFLVNCGNIIAGGLLCVIGLYASAEGIKRSSITKKPFSCTSI